MSTKPHRTKLDDRLGTFFTSVSAASIVAVSLYLVFFLGYLLTHPDLITALQDSLIQRRFIELQHVLEQIDAGVMSVSGWVRLALGLGLLLVSLVFVLNTGGIVFSVFIHSPFSAGGTPTVSWWRLSLSRSYLTIRLLFFISAYKAAGVRAFSILEQFFPGNELLSVGFFLSSSLSFGTMIVLASVIKVVVYEVGRYEVMVNENRASVLEALGEYLKRWKNEMIILEEGTFSEDQGYVKAKLEDATRDMRSNIRLLERARSDLTRLSSPNQIIRKLFLTFVGVVVLQIVTDIILVIGWGTILEFVIGLATHLNWSWVM
ncbi:MAG: conserved membrane protein of unknown function [Candidatus Thorarchaeota archaeon]|nr:MAG: conserved membrane protein of unknown function [Candidatus Thorarchaeota archaeon]